jgi:hypothetical protein
MQVDKWIDLKSVIPQVLDVIDDNIVDEGLIYELAYRALKKLQTNEQLVPKVSFLTLENYKTCLPKDLVRLDMVIHKEYVDISQSTTDLEEFYTSYNNMPGLLNPENLATYLISKSWKVMLRPTNKFSSIYFCNKEYDLDYTCKYDYTVVPGDTLVSSLKEGLIAIAYMSDPTLDGEFLIPDDEDVKSAIKSYVLMNIWESRFNIMEAGSDSRFQYYASDWAIKKAVVKGKLKMPTLEEMEQIMWHRLNLAPATQQIDTFYQFLGVPTGWDLNGKSHPSY